MPKYLNESEHFKAAPMGLDLQPDGLTAGLAGHCQPDEKYP